MNLDQTHDPQLISWIDSANAESSDFPLQNLPFGVFSQRGISGVKKIGVAIGDKVLDLAATVKADLISNCPFELINACSAHSLNGIMSLEGHQLNFMRHQLFKLLSSSANSETQRIIEKLLIASADCEMHLPAAIGDYTDFYASIEHASNVGRLFRPDTPLFANYKHMPIGYHGRASSIVPSGAEVKRPRGQSKSTEATQPSIGPSSQLDYELELGLFIRGENSVGTPTSIDKAAERIFGFCLLNDWSARDIQSWEYQPLGPFLAKSFTTSISPWVVTSEALRPFRVPARLRAAEDPPASAYLFDLQDQQAGGFSVRVETLLTTEAMRRTNLAPYSLSIGSTADLYWTFSQMIAHHTSNGCNLRPGDLLGSGTISGSLPSSRGCLLELTERGKFPIRLPNGEERKFLEDGDEIILKARCIHPQFRSIGFGECRGMIRGANE